MGRVAVAVAVAILAAACSADELTEPPVTTEGSVATTAPTTTLAPTATPTTSVEPVSAVPDYLVVEKVAGESGDVLVVLLEDGTYDDVDIENLMVHLVDEFGPYGIHVVDNEAAVELVLAEDMELSDPLLAEHYLAWLEEGNKVVYAGPLAEFGWFFVGS